MIEKVRRTIRKHDMLNEGDWIITGISGGPDSVALLLALNALKAEFQLTLFAAHVNYKLRGEESDKDEAFVDALCEKLKVPLYKKVCNLKDSKGISIQERARADRYCFYEELCNIHGANKIAVGHILNDSVETILLNLMRGSGSKGLSGIPPVRNNTNLHSKRHIVRARHAVPEGEACLAPTSNFNAFSFKIIRPLIECSRDEIIEFLKLQGQDYSLDSSKPRKQIPAKQDQKLSSPPFIK